MKQTKASIYKSFGIEYKAGKIFHPVLGWIRPLLINGNEKLGADVWTWSTLPTNRIFTLTIEINGKKVDFEIKGTCPCACKGCYATTGNFRYDSTKESLARKTWVAYYDLPFMTTAIKAQIIADRIEFLRIHASGDFFSLDYIKAWKDIANASKNTIFWTYTKFVIAESAFDSVENVNVVKSIIPGCGFNFGKCDHVLNTYKTLKESNESVYICRCGIDKNQHCNNCKGCSAHKYVLFLEHGTGYKVSEDPLFETVKALIESQPKVER